MTGSYWTCRRKTLGTPCQRVNPSRVQNCRACGKRKPAKRRAKHMAALELSYAEYVTLNGGEQCGICGKAPTSRRLDRDHTHVGDGTPRGLLCRSCNRALVGTRFGMKLTPEWLRNAATYLERAAGRDAT